MKKTKIIATLGPVTESEEMLEKIIEAGVDIARLNFSHGDFAEHQMRLDRFRAALAKTRKEGEVLQDLGGPKIRIGLFKTETHSIVLVPGNTFTLTTEKSEENQGSAERVFVNYQLLPKEVEVGHIIFLNDGKQKLEVVSISGTEVVSKVLVGGEIKGRRGVNLPHSDLSVKALTEKDMKDLEFGIRNKVNFIALSFVRKPEDISELREILQSKGCDAKIIAKVETPQAVKNIDEIVKLSDGIMVARGDLAIEVPFEKVPMIQKMIVKKCNEAGKFVIVATQILESMIMNSVPTRAEVSDIANAVLDGTDALMLSEESALGHFPLQAVEVMRKVANEIEGNS